ncbi:MAG: flagellar basal body rod protein FlgB [Deltaproteobacteria bacterium]|nr:flagellar basal body rod protein FlgB [Deltaproteobacteria bacterium]
MNTIFSGIDGMARALDFHVARQNAISANIANVDTPGYVPRELVRPGESDGGRHVLPLATTDGSHIRASEEGGGNGFEVVEQREVTPGNDLNYVSLDREMARMTANAVRFEAVAKLVALRLGGLRYAATDR